MPGTISAAFLAFGSVAGLAIVPFGPISAKLKGNEPWRSMDAQASMFTLVRAQRFSGLGLASCDVWTNGLRNLEYGTPYDPAVTGGDSAAWQPWSKEDLEMIRSCVRSPCKVKLDPTELGELAASSPDSRYSKYLGILSTRANAYKTTLVRRGYEKAEPPIDAWSKLVEKGAPISEPPPPVELWARKIDYKAGPMKPVHQILDRRYLKQGNEAQLWVRDLYTDHYFDGWGERVYLACDPESKDAFVIQALVLEFDLMRKTDFFSKLARPRMRAAVQELGYRYLDEKADSLKKYVTGQ